MASRRRRAPMIHFKPIVTVDPAQSRAAQIARRGPRLTVKFPRIDFDNLPSWPPLSDAPGDVTESIEKEKDDDDDSNTAKENNQGNGNDAEEHLDTLAMPPPLNEQPPRRAPSRRPSIASAATAAAARVTRSSAVPATSRVDTFITSQRKKGSAHRWRPSRVFAPNLLLDHSSRTNSPVAHPSRFTSVLTSPKPACTSCPDRLGGDGGGVVSVQARNKTPVSVTGTRASRLGSRAAAPISNSAGRSPSRPVRSFSHVESADDGEDDNDKAASTGESHIGAPALNEERSSSSFSFIPKESPPPAPSPVTAAAPHAHPAAEGSHARRPAVQVQSTFKMAMALSKPYQPGPHVPNQYHHLVVVSGEPTHPESTQLFSNFQPEARDVASDADDAILGGGNRTPPRLGRRGSQRDSMLGVPINLGVDHYFSSSDDDGGGVFPRPAGSRGEEAATTRLRDGNSVVSSGLGRVADAVQPISGDPAAAAAASISTPRKAALVRGNNAIVKNECSEDEDDDDDTLGDFLQNKKRRRRQEQQHDQAQGQWRQHIQHRMNNVQVNRRLEKATTTNTNTNARGVADSQTPRWRQRTIHRDAVINKEQQDRSFPSESVSRLGHGNDVNHVGYVGGGGGGDGAEPQHQQPQQQPSSFRQAKGLNKKATSTTPAPDSNTTIAGGGFRGLLRDNNSSSNNNNSLLLKRSHEGSWLGGSRKKEKSEARR